MSECPDIAAWEGLAAGGLPAEEAGRLEEHLRGCAPCRERLERVRRHETFVPMLRVALSGGAAGNEDDWGQALVGRTIGRWRILRVLGTGGMATVFEAEQDEPHRRVALKLVHARSASATRRFELEGEILARLQHPGIAQVYQTGAVEIGDARPRGEGALRSRRPFIAMELVEGRTLIADAAAARLDDRQRLALLARVCDAVQYAHERGVIHRDLKPANIIVDQRGEPRILDFGVARLIEAGAGGPSALDRADAHTLEGMVVGTLAYMSPEQAGGDPREIDTRTDIYALGVIGYELLASRRPYEVGSGVVEAIDTIRTRRPAPLGTIDPRFRGDVEAIIDKALEKDRARRYASAAAMADDIRRHLTFQPVSARPLTAMYQLTRFARRHRALVGGAAATVAALALGLGIATYGLLAARREAALARLAEAEAQQRRRGADELSEVLMSMLRAANPHEARGRDYTVRALLDDVARGIDQRLGDHPEHLAAIRATIGNAYRLLGLFDLAAPHLEAALALRRRAFGDEHALVASSTCDLAWLMHDRAQYAAAADEFRAALALQRRLFTEPHNEIAGTLLGLSDVLRHLGRFDESRPLAEQALAMRRAANPVYAAAVGEALANLGKLERETGAIPAARARMEEAITEFRAAYGDRHPRLVDAMNELGWVLQLRRERDAADRLMSDALAMGRELLGDRHPDVANTRYELGLVKLSRDDLDGAEHELRAALAIYTAAHGEHHPSVATAMDSLARVLVRRKQFDEAERLMRDSLAMRRQLHGEHSGEYAAGLTGIATLLRAKGDPGVEPAYRAALAAWTTVGGERHPETATCRVRLAEICADSGRHSEAFELLSAGEPVLRERIGPRHAESLRAGLALGRALQALGRHAEAEPVLAGVIERARDRGKGFLRQCMTARAECLRALGRVDEARALEEQAAGL